MLLLFIIMIFKKSLYLSIIFIIINLDCVFGRGGHGHGHSHSHGHIHNHGHRNVKIRTIVGTAAILDLYIFHKFQNAIEYSSSDNNIYNISYIRSFNDNIKNYTCIYYTQTNNTIMNSNNIISNDVIINIDLKQYSRDDNLHKYCSYKYLYSDTNNYNTIFIILILLFTCCYCCSESHVNNRINAY